jgi:hypothetical protein
MDRIRIQPGYYYGFTDPNFRTEIVKYFQEVSRSDSIFPIARDDYYSMSASDWEHNYKEAVRLVSAGRL